MSGGLRVYYFFSTKFRLVSVCATILASLVPLIFIPERMELGFMSPPENSNYNR